MLMLKLGMKNNILALILPSMFGVFNIIVMRTFFTSLPDSISESGKMDGANDFIIFYRLYLPMALPGLATIGLFIALGYWNEWYNAMLFITNEKLIPLQYQLYKVINRASMADRLSQLTGRQASSVPSETIKLAMVCVTVGPVVFLFPYIQKFFIRGLTIGAGQRVTAPGTGLSGPAKQCLIRPGNSFRHIIAELLQIYILRRMKL